MTVFLISRHPGAIDWLLRQTALEPTISGQKMPVQVKAHLNMAAVHQGDLVVGLLPVHMAGQVCQKGAQYWHLCMELPPWARGRELTADDMDSFNARLEQFIVLAPADSAGGIKR